MDNAVAKFLIEKISKDPSFEKCLSAEDLRGIEDYKQTQMKGDLAEEKYAKFLEKCDKYTYRQFPLNTTYWNKTYHDDIMSYVEVGMGKYFFANFTEDEFNQKITTWLKDEAGDVPDPFADKKLMSEKEIFDAITRRYVGDLVDAVKGRDRFFICYHEPYVVKSSLGHDERIDAHISTIDILRGTGVYAIMSYSNGAHLDYFNKHYFKSASEITDGDELFKVINFEYNSFTKRKNEKFRLCEIGFENEHLEVKSMSELMTYEEHFKRLFGFLPECVKMKTSHDNKEVH